VVVRTEPRPPLRKAAGSSKQTAGWRRGSPTGLAATRSQAAGRESKRNPLLRTAALTPVSGFLPVIPPGFRIVAAVSERRSGSETMIHRHCCSYV
jgi:hypothetical protein